MALGSLCFLSQSLQGPLVLALGVVASGAFLLISRVRRQAVATLVAAVAAALVAAIGVYAYINRLGPLGAIRDIDTVRFRERYWEAAWNIMLAKPLWGTGPDGYARYLSEYRSESYILSPGSTARVTAAHDVPLQVGSTLGIVALIAWVVLMISATVVMLLSAASSRNRLLGAALFGGWIAYVSQSLISIDYPSLKSLGWLMLGLGLGFALANQHPPGTSHKGAFVASGALGLVCASMFATSLAVDDGVTLSRSGEHEFSSLGPCSARTTNVEDLLRRGNIVGAVQAGERAYALDPRCPGLGNLVAVSLLNDDQLPKARAVAEETVVLDPLAPDAWLNLAFIAVAQGDQQGARVALGEATRLDSLDPSTDLGAPIADLQARLGETASP